MRKLTGLLLLCLLAGVLTGCASRSKDYAGYYASDDPVWYVDLTEDGSFTYSFWEPQEGAPTFFSTGHCDFSGKNPDTPAITTNMDMMKGRFSFAFSPDKSQLVVFMNGESKVSQSYGNRVKLFRRSRPIR